MMGLPAMVYPSGVKSSGPARLPSWKIQTSAPKLAHTWPSWSVAPASSSTFLGCHSRRPGAMEKAHRRTPGRTPGARACRPHPAFTGRLSRLATPSPCGQRLHVSGPLLPAPAAGRRCQPGGGRDDHHRQSAAAADDRVGSHARPEGWSARVPWGCCVAGTVRGNDHPRGPRGTGGRCRLRDSPSTMQPCPPSPAASVPWSSPSPCW